MRATARERASRREQLDGCMLRRTASLLRTELTRDAFARPTHAPSTLSQAACSLFLSQATEGKGRVP